MRGTLQDIKNATWYTIKLPWKLPETRGGLEWPVSITLLPTPADRLYACKGHRQRLIAHSGVKFLSASKVHVRHTLCRIAEDGRHGVAASDSQPLLREDVSRTLMFCSLLAMQDAASETRLTGVI